MSIYQIMKHDEVESHHFHGTEEEKINLETSLLFEEMNGGIEGAYARDLRITIK